MIKPEDSADKHWEWINGLLEKLSQQVRVDNRSTMEYLFKTGFIHGYKHGEETKDGKT